MSVHPSIELCVARFVSYLEEMSERIWCVGKRPLHECGEPPTSQCHLVQPWQLAGDDKVNGRDVEHPDHFEHVTADVQKPQASLEADAGDQIERVPLKVLGQVDHLALQVLQDLDEDGRVVVGVGLVVPEIRHGVHLGRGGPQCFVQSRVSCGEDIV